MKAPLFLILCALAAAGGRSSAEEFLDTSADVSTRSGLFCFRTITETNNKIHLMEYSDGAVRQRFAVDMPTCMPPICLTNGVVIASTDGVIRKLDINGNVIFANTPPGFVGALGLSGRISYGCIFTSETLEDAQQKGLRYALHLVDISGKEPVTKATFDIVQPLSIKRALDDVVVVGQKDVLRFKIPNNCKDAWDRP